MEEILASIRRIISEDGPPPIAEMPAAQAPVSASQPPGDELILTQVLAEDGKVVALSQSDTEPAKPEPLDVLLLTQALPASAPTSVRPFPRIVPQAPALWPVAAPEAQSASAAMKMREGASGISLDDFLRQSLEAKIQEWMNGNLPGIVERLVQQEIDRIARKVE